MFAAENDEIVPVPGRTYSESLESGSRGLYKGFYNSGTERVPSGVSLTSEALTEIGLCPGLLAEPFNGILGSFWCLLCRTRHDGTFRSATLTTPVDVSFSMPRLAVYRVLRFRRC